jgi:hypothetical protein
MLHALGVFDLAPLLELLENRTSVVKDIIVPPDGRAQQIRGILTYL